jgi:hypothetical protein
MPGIVYLNSDCLQAVSRPLPFPSFPRIEITFDSQVKYFQQRLKFFSKNNDSVSLPIRNLISQLIESCHGWNVLRWQELYDSEPDSIKPNTIFLARDLGSTVGIEVKNVIVDLSPVRPKVHTVRIKD